ncbi:MAG: lipopolysaccharide assembly protein LapA domain-containing protein [Mycobacteriaceae bacterium]
MSSAPHISSGEPVPGEPVPPMAAEPDISHPSQSQPSQSQPSQPQGSEVKFTRAAALWSSLILGFLILIVLLIFIAQNTASTPFTFLGWHWNLQLGVAILLAAVCGGLITALVSAARMFQLRRVAKKNLVAARRR